MLRGTALTLSVVGENMVFPAGRRTFLFTYYVDREEVLPTLVDVRIRGERLCNDESFETNVLIAPYQSTRSRSASTA